MKEARGIRNNNPLNIRKGSTWRGEIPVQTDTQFEQFESMQMGIRAGLKLIRNHVTGFGGQRRPFNTIAKLIRVWAPASENDTESYIRSVSRQLGVRSSCIINPYDRKFMAQLAQAMATVECGQQLPLDIFLSAYDLL